MRLRTGHQLLHCEGSEATSSMVPEEMIRRQIQPNEIHKLIYCGIEKAGSTFWRRFLQCLSKRIVQSPFKIKAENVIRNNIDVKKTGLVKILGLLQSSTKFTFVRNPYTRLLSGYVDKIYSPNPYYWKLGAKAVRLSRRVIFPCGHDTTFNEFVDYIIYVQNNRKERDEHFIPGHELCIPCQIHHDIIGKMETFANDTFYILEKLNLTEYVPHLKDFKRQSALDAIYDVSQAYIAFRKVASRCLKYEDSLKRIWRKLQIRGLISDQIKFPFSVNDAKYISNSEFSSKLIEAHKQSQKYDLKTLKRNYLIDAYNMIPLQTMFKLAEVYKLDFKIFDYEMFPEYLFRNRTDYVSNNIFSIINI